jgi:hypothetical protein
MPVGDFQERTHRYKTGISNAPHWIPYHFQAKHAPKFEQTYRPSIPEAPKTATFKPASEPLPPGPVSVALRSVIRGTTGVLVESDLVAIVLELSLEL